MGLRDLARPLCQLPTSTVARKMPEVHPVVPADPRVAFTISPQRMQVKAQLLQEQQRRLQFSKGVR